MSIKSRSDILALVISLATVAVGQDGRAAAKQQAGACSVNLIGEGNTASVSCMNIDRKLAEQIDALAAASKRDERVLKVLQARLDALLKEVHNLKPTVVQSAPGGINSVVEGGNSTVINTVINSGPVPRRILGESRAACIAQLKSHPATVAISAIQSGEAYAFARDWYEVFKAAGWAIADDRVATVMISGDPGSGIEFGFRGAPVQPGGVVQVAAETPERGLVECAKLVAPAPGEAHAQRWPNMPEGRISLTVLEPRRQP